MLRIVTFGEATISVGGEQIAPSAHRMFALALYLGAERGRAVPRSVLQAQLFGDSDERAGSHNLRQLVYRLRRLGAPIVTTASTLSLAPEHARADYGELLEVPSLTGEQLDLVAKGFLPGYAPLVSDAYLEWVDAFRGRITLALRRKAIEAMTVARDRCDWAAVARAAQACLALDPLNEDAMLGHAEALAMSGSKAEALERIERYLAELPVAAEDCRAAARRLRQRIMRRVSEPAPLSLREMPLVGREEEMRRLTAALARTRSEGGGVVLISGEPGIGKTRLLTEFERLAALGGAQTARVVCRASTSHQPLSPFIELTRMLLQMPGALGCSPEALERLRTLCLVPASRTHITAEMALDPDAAFEDTASALVDLMESVSAEAPLVLTLDDAHWLDPASADATRHLAGALRDATVLLLLASRDGALPDLPRDDRRIEVLGVRRLPTDAAAGLMRRFVPLELRTPDFEQLLGIASGNPLLVQLLGSQYARTGGPILAPSAVTDLYLRRLDLLSPDARSLLEYALMLGRNASLARIHDTFGLSTADLASALREVERIGLAHLEDGLLLPSHPLISDVVLAKVPQSVRQIFHRRAATALAAEYAKSGEADLLWDCTDHWEQSGEIAETVDYLRRCSAHSLSLGRAQAASETLRRALRMRPLAASVRHDLLSEALSVCELSGEWDEIGRLIEACGGNEVGRVTSNVLSESDIVALDALRIIGTLGSYDPTPVFHVLKSAPSHPSTRLRAAVFLLSLADESFDARLAAAVRDATACIPVNDANEVALKEKCELIYETAFGDVSLATASALQFLERLRAYGVEPKHVNTCFALAYSLARCGVFTDARQLLLALLSRLESWRLRYQEVRCRSYLAWIAIRDQQVRLAAELHEETVALAAASRCDPPLLMHSNAVELAILDRRYSDALRETDRAATRFGSLRRGKMRLELLQLTIRARVGGGMVPCSPEDLDELLEGHLRARAFGLQDDATEALGMALRHYDRLDEARILVGAYVERYRRDPFPLSAGLKRLFAEIQS